MKQFLTGIAINTLPVNFWRNQAARHTERATECPNRTNRQLLIDVSEISKSDAGTGIQRVVRNLYQQLLADPPAGYQIRPIAATRKRFYGYLPSDFLQQPNLTNIPFRPVQVSEGDLFFGLDLSAHLLPHHMPKLVEWRKRGLRMSFIIYDLLPVLQPDWFNSKATKNFHRWLRAMAILADSAIAISRTVQTDFSSWMQRAYNLNADDLRCSTIRLGAELNTPLSPALNTRSDCYLPANLAAQKFVLVVGTIEPRKGHECLLNAFETLWENAEKTHLVIAGKQGWKVEALIRRLQTHPQIGKQLHWLNTPCDDVLHALYQHCKGVIVASKGEGFGLPLIEAAYFNKPVLARDISVFREIAEDNVSYFSNMEPDGLDTVLPAWLDQLDASNDVFRPATLLTWRKSYEELMKVLSSTFKQR